MKITDEVMAKLEKQNLQLIRTKLCIEIELKIHELFIENNLTSAEMRFILSETDLAVLLRIIEKYDETKES